MDYPEIAHDSIDVGTTLFTLIEPRKGREAAYHRWYERDHFFAGCLIGPGWFSGRRWVATKPLKDLRFPTETPFLPDVAAGSYLSTYWVLKGHEEDAIDWGSTQVKWLHENDRMFDERDHVHTAMYANRWSVSRDEDGVPLPLALEHPFKGFVAVMVDRHEDTAPRAFSAWLREVAVPSAMEGSSWALTGGLTPIPLPEGAPVFQPENKDHDRRMLLMCFLDEDPRDDFSIFEAFAEAVDEGGLGTVSYVAPFIPTIPGTDTYTDQLWD